MNGLTWFRAMEAYQQRAINERDDLTTKLAALDAFIDNGVFRMLDDAEQKRLNVQRALMSGYLDILNERIAAFPK